MRRQSTQCAAEEPHAAQPCDVFICHRGPDTKLKVLSHIRKSFKGRAASLDVFSDTFLPKGQQLMADNTGKAAGGALRARSLVAEV